jgi:hypothetical protein
LSIDDNKSDRKIEFASTKNIPEYPDFLMFRLNLSDFFTQKLNLTKEAMKDFITPSWKIFQLQIQEITLY